MGTQWADVDEISRRADFEIFCGGAKERAKGDAATDGVGGAAGRRCVDAKTAAASGRMGRGGGVSGFSTFPDGRGDFAPDVGSGGGHPTKTPAADGHRRDRSDRAVHTRAVEAGRKDDFPPGTTSGPQNVSPSTQREGERYAATHLEEIRRPVRVGAGGRQKRPGGSEDF